MVLAAAFDRARTVDDDRLFAVKGGVTIELRLGLRARSSQDFDVSYAVPLDELLARSMLFWASQSANSPSSE